MTDENLTVILDGYKSIMSRTGCVLRWTVFALFHTILLAAFLLFVWWFAYSPIQVASMLRKISQDHSLPTILAVLSGLGLSVLAIVFFYVKIWLKIYNSSVDSFILKEIPK